jgi:hypothetical protein
MEISIDFWLQGHDHNNFVQLCQRSSLFTRKLNPTSITYFKHSIFPIKIKCCVDQLRSQ